MSKQQPDIDYLASLSRISCTEEEKAQLGLRLEKILSYMALLEEVDTKGVPSCTHVMENVANVMREDKVEQGFTREEFFANVPEHVGAMVKIPPIVHLEGV